MPWRFFSADVFDIIVHMILVFVSGVSSEFDDSMTLSTKDLETWVIGISFFPFLHCFYIFIIQLNGRGRTGRTFEDIEGEARNMLAAFEAVVSAEVVGSLLQVITTRDTYILQESCRIIETELRGNQQASKNMFNVRQLTYDNFAMQVFQSQAQASRELPGGIEQAAPPPQNEGDNGDDGADGGDRDDGLSSSKQDESLDIARESSDGHELPESTVINMRHERYSSV